MRWWFDQLTDEVLKEEGYQGDNVCRHCMERYGKDSRQYIDASLEQRYYLSILGVPDSGIEVTREKFIEMERNAGFGLSNSKPDQLATGGFTSGALVGSIKNI